MSFEKTPIEGLLIFKPKIFQDERGYFFESYNKNKFIESGITTEFVQDNQSFSSFGTLRGLHFQTGDSAQAKLVRVIQGEVLDVAVDLRPNSSTFGKHFSIILSGENQFQLFIPRGFAHGFSVLSPTALFHYKCDNFYNKEAEDGLHFADPNLQIDWKIPNHQVQVSAKDQKLGSFHDYCSRS